MTHHSYASWIAVQVVPRNEAKVAILLQYKGYQSFLPMYKVRRKWSDRVKLLDSPLFPGYVFCRSGKETVGLIIATPQVIRIVGFGGKPSFIEDEEIDALRQIGTSGATLEPCSYLRIGDRVQIKDGPLAGITGLLVEIRNQRRLVISIDAIMKSISVDVASIEVCSVKRELPACSMKKISDNRQTGDRRPLVMSQS